MIQGFLSTTTVNEHTFARKKPWKSRYAELTNIDLLVNVYYSISSPHT